MKNPKFIAGEIYHICNRGVDKRIVFRNDSQRFRFIHDLYEFNDEAPAENIYYKNDKFTLPESYEVRLRKIRGGGKQAKNTTRKLLVKIHAFCLMPNHFHLLIEQLAERGISRFMQKLGTGYTNYFNQIEERSGVLFQGKFKAVLLKNENHFIHIPYYIHSNPLDLSPHKTWRERKLTNPRAAMKFLETYRWSSFMDYIGKKNFPSITQRDFLLDFFNNPKEYKAKTAQWLSAMEVETIDSALTLD